MTSQLSSDQLERLTPLLGSMARLIASGSEPRDDDLEILLLGADLEAEPQVLGELKRWDRLLRGVADNPREQRRRTTVEALMLRGLAEAPVLLAVDTVATGNAASTSPAAPTPVQGLAASVSSLDFGSLPAAQTATLEFEVEGGPGQIVADSDQVNITPMQFGVEPTPIQVDVRPIGSGLLWTTVKLVTSGETLELPLVAQWGEILSTPPAGDPDRSQVGSRAVESRGDRDTSLPHILQGHRKAVESVAFAPDGCTLASGGQDGNVRMWDVGAGRETSSLTHPVSVRSVAFSPDGLTLAAGLGDGMVWLWRLSTGIPTQKLTGDLAGAAGVAFSPDGKTLALATGLEVQLRRVDDGTLVSHLEGHQSTVHSVAFSPSGSILASGAYDRTIRLWDAETGKELRRLEGHEDTVTTVAFSPDGCALVSGSGLGDRTIRLWRVEDGSLMSTLRSHSSGVTSSAFRADGRVLASGSYDNTVRLWSAEHGLLLHILEGHTDAVLSVAFSPHGRILASGSVDRTVRLWRTRIILAGQ